MNVDRQAAKRGARHRSVPRARALRTCCYRAAALLRSSGIARSECAKSTGDDPPGKTGGFRLWQNPSALRPQLGSTVFPLRPSPFWESVPSLHH